MSFLFVSDRRKNFVGYVNVAASDVRFDGWTNDGGGANGGDCVGLEAIR